ncbi:unnamed protein product [Lampetra planeri]
MSTTFMLDNHKLHHPTPTFLEVTLDRSLTFPGAPEDNSSQGQNQEKPHLQTSRLNVGRRSHHHHSPYHSASHSHCQQHSSVHPSVPGGAAGSHVGREATRIVHNRTGPTDVRAALRICSSAPLTLVKRSAAPPPSPPHCPASSFH